MSHRDVRELHPRSAALDCSVQHISFIHINGRPVVSFVQSYGPRGVSPLISAPAVSPRVVSLLVLALVVSAPAISPLVSLYPSGMAPVVSFVVSYPAVSPMVSPVTVIPSPLVLVSVVSAPAVSSLWYVDIIEVAIA
jgi:hypothetical protein